MTDNVEQYRLKPEDLDPIVADLDLREAGALERLQVWYRDVLTKLGDWFKQASGGEGGWWDRLSNWINSVSAGNPISADNVIDTITILTIVSICAGIAYITFILWQTFRPLDSNQSTNTNYLLSDPDLQKPLQELSKEQWAPALLAQVCMSLVQHQRLTLLPNATNLAIARDADLPRELRSSLGDLADAADRSLFAGWAPTAADAEALRAHRDRIISTVARGR